MLRIITFLVVSLGTINLFAQNLQLTNWEAYTSMYEVNSLTEDNDKVYAATNGGVYFADLISGNIEQFTNVNGLSRTEAKFITHNIQSDKVFVGYNDGVFDIYSNGVWTPIFDIFNAGFVRPNINHIEVEDNVAYISGGFGLVVFNHEENVTIEDVKRIADFNPGTEVRTIKIHNGKIWIATSSGVAYTDLDGSLANRSDWNTIVPESNFHSSDIVDIEWVGDSLYATSGDYIYSWNGDFLMPVFNYEIKEILGLSQKNNELYFFKEKEIIKHPSNTQVLFNDELINNIQFDNSSDDIFIASVAGVQISKTDTTISISPNTPISNGFADIYIDKDGTLWAGTGRVGSSADRNRGLMSLKDGQWSHFNRLNTPDFIVNTIVKVNGLSDGTITSSTYGGGIYFLHPDRPEEIELLNSKNSSLETISGSGSFTIIGDVFEDERGNVWMVNWGNSGTGPLFVVRTPSGTYETLFNCGGSNKRTYFKTAIDFTGTKWVGSSGTDVKLMSSEVSVGLAYYNEMGTLSDKSDDVCGLLTVNNSDLNSNLQTAVTFDKQGTLWLGSEGGVNRIINPTTVMNNGTPIIINVRALANQNVREIIVDALDNKWIATADGLYVIDPDGEEILFSINTENSPLPTNSLYTLEYDENSGKVYIGTEKGMYSVQTSAVKPLPSYSLKVYPQPYDATKSDRLTIEGLAENSDLRIVTVDGELVRSIKVNSRTTTWDGRNENGEKASTGVYLLYAVSSTNESTEVLKFAIIND